MIFLTRRFTDFENFDQKCFFIYQKTSVKQKYQYIKKNNFLVIFLVINVLNILPAIQFNLLISNKLTDVTN